MGGAESLGEANIEFLKSVRERIEKELGHLKKEIKDALMFQTLEDVRYFVNSGKDAKERYVLYLILKAHGKLTNADKGKTLDELRGYFTEEFGKEIGGGYFKDGTWRVTDFWPLGIDGDSHESYMMEFVNRHSEILGILSGGLYTGQLSLEGRLEFFDKREAQLMPSKKDIAKEKNGDWFVLYFLLKDRGFYVDHRWNIDDLNARFTEQKGKEHFGFYFKDGAWYTIDVAGVDEKHDSPSFLKAFEQTEGISYELLQDIQDAAPYAQHGKAVVSHVESLRKEYWEFKNETLH